MKSQFLSDLDVRACKLQEGIWILKSPLIYFSKMLDERFEIKRGFCMDFASVPRLPLVYRLWGNRAHREAVLHDFAYRTDAMIPFDTANMLFLEAMVARDKPSYISKPMYWGVCIGGKGSYHKRTIDTRCVKTCKQNCVLCEAA